MTLPAVTTGEYDPIGSGLVDKLIPNEDNLCSITASLTLDSLKYHTAEPLTGSQFQAS
jgi:hypothetical protein